MHFCKLAAACRQWRIYA